MVTMRFHHLGSVWIRADLTFLVFSPCLSLSTAGGRLLRYRLDSKPTRKHWWLLCPKVTLNGHLDPAFIHHWEMKSNCVLSKEFENISQRTADSLLI